MTDAGAADANRHAWALEQSGAWDEAGITYSRAFHRAARRGEGQAMADAARGGARVRHLTGRLEEAEEMALLSERLAVLHGLPGPAARAANVRATIRFAQGDLEGARPLFQLAQEQARHARDDELLGLVAQNLGVIANIRGELAEARLLYLESIAATLRSRDKHAALRAYNNLGLLSSDLKEWMESDLYFDRGIELAERHDDRPLLAKLYANRAEPLIQMGEVARARESLARAEALALELGDPGTAVQVVRFRAVIARMEGELDEADRCLRDALAGAERAGLELERAEILGGVARLRWEQGRHAEARAAVVDARARFAALGAAREIRRLDDVIAEWGT